MAGIKGRWTEIDGKREKMSIIRAMTDRNCREKSKSVRHQRHDGQK
ncbi:hypothetical protein [Bacillus sp. ISL-39]|nr:hypothetical protein [Bacillus sp. ISL-39]MBT2638414.1 hypothetical protein [Bacillus sp. ISL-39]